ncbi:MAG: cadherin-like domain-containing protein [Eubacteriales bacterium]
MAKSLSKKKKAKKIILTAVIIISVLMFLSGAYAAYNARISEDSAVSMALDDVTTPEKTPISTSTPSLEPSPTIRKAYIPDPNELLPIPDVKKIEINEDALISEYQEDILSVSWEVVEDADYYVFCAMNEKDVVYHKEILWPDISEWMLPDIRDGNLYLFCYEDMGEDGAEDDKLIETYSVPIISPAEDTPEPDATPAPKNTEEKVLNKYLIIVDKSDFTFAAFTYDEKGDYTILVKAFPTAIGRSARMTPNGTFEISSKGEWKSWGTGSYSPFYTRFTSGLYFHGALYDEKKNNTMYKSYYNEIGTAASGGCLRTTYEAAQWVYYNCPAGTVVQIVDSSPLVNKVIKPPIDPAYPSWDPTDPSKPKLDPPVVSINDGLQLNEGAEASLAGLLVSTDAKFDDDNLIYEVVTLPINGELSKTKFTQKELNDGVITYTHNGSETIKDRFEFTVTNKSSVTSIRLFGIRILPVDDSPPVVDVNKWMELDNGGTHSLQGLLSASDAEIADEDLVFTITTMPENGSIPSTFTMADILAGEVVYIHNGSDSETDSFIFSVSDGENELTGQMFSISIEPPPEPETTPEPTTEATPEETAEPTPKATEPEPSS